MEDVEDEEEASLTDEVAEATEASLLIGGVGAEDDDGTDEEREGQTGGTCRARAGCFSFAHPLLACLVCLYPTLSV